MDTIFATAATTVVDGDGGMDIHKYVYEEMRNCVLMVWVTLLEEKEEEGGGVRGWGRKEGRGGCVLRDSQNPCLWGYVRQQNNLEGPLGFYDIYWYLS